MNVRHDAEVLLTLTGERYDGTRFTVEERVVPVATLDGAITVMGIIYNRLAVSGGVEWWNPRDGQRFHRPQYTYVLTDPDTQVLVDGALCTCDDCLRSEASS